MSQFKVGDKVRLIARKSAAAAHVFTEQDIGEVFTVAGTSNCSALSAAYISVKEKLSTFPANHVRVDNFERVARKRGRPATAPNHAVAPSGESTPEGGSLNVPGAKADAGKPRMSLVLGGFSQALQAVAAVGTFGAAKYTDNGWQTVANGQERYEDALLRHLLKAKVEDADPDSDLLHLAHAAWNALAVLELYLKK